MRLTTRVVALWIVISGVLVSTVAAHSRRPAPTPEEVAWSRHATTVRAALKASKAIEPDLPPAPEGVTDLRFNEIFKPIGPGGLEFTEKVNALNGQRVRLAGYMVKQQLKPNGLLLLTPLPVSTDEPEYGQADELPPATVHVFVPHLANQPLPLITGRLVLTGRLELGPREEIDGRNSHIRLYVDPPASDTSVALGSLASTQTGAPLSSAK